jgi:glycosyltransferase involved in cell wall biosynthesis
MEPRKDESAKIMIAIPSLSAGGAERVVSTLANRWAETGRDVVIATFEPPSAEHFYELGGGVRVERLELPAISKPKWRAVARTFERISDLRRLMRRERPDVVISFLTKMNVMAVQAARPLGVPVIISERNNPYVQQFDPFWNMARAVAFPKAFAFVTMTEGAARFFPERQRPRTRIIPNPVAAMPTKRSEGAQKTLAAVGRLTAQKRFDRLLEAFSLVAPDFPEWTLVIWGEGELRGALEEQRDRLGLSARVKLPGLTATPGAWAETADILAITSDYEGWPNVVIEALAAGVPVVAADCEFGVREILNGGDLGLIVPKDDVAALAAALSRMMSDSSLRRAFSAKGVNAAKAYSPPAIAAQWDALIDEALARRKRQRSSSSETPS